MGDKVIEKGKLSYIDGAYERVGAEELSLFNLTKTAWGGVFCVGEFEGDLILDRGFVSGVSDGRPG